MQIPKAFLGKLKIRVLCATGQKPCLTRGAGRFIKIQAVDLRSLR